MPEQQHTIFYIVVTLFCAIGIGVFTLFPLTYALVGFGLLIAVPILAYLILNGFPQLLFLYIASIPFIQHLSWFAIIIGDFAITPHMALFVAVILSWIHRILADPEPFSIINDTLDKYFLLLILFSIIPLLFGYSLPVNHVKRWLLFYTGMIETTIFFVMVRHCLRKGILDLDDVLRALVFTSFAALAAAFWELSIHGFGIVQIYASRMRMGFGYHNTNLFGIHSSIMYPILFYAAVHKAKVVGRPLAYASLAILVILSILCFNRGTFLVLGFQTALLFLARENRRLIVWMTLLFSVILIFNSEIIVFYIARFFLGSGVKEATAIIDQSAAYRLDAWLTGLQVMLHYPWGVGAGSFQYMWEMFGTRPTLYLGTPHHLFISIGVDYGIPCLVMFIVILLRSFRNAVAPPSFVAMNDKTVLRYIHISLIGFVLYGLLTDGELSHLSGFTVPNNGYTLVLFILIAAVAHIGTDRRRVVNAEAV